MHSLRCSDIFILGNNNDKKMFVEPISLIEREILKL